MPSPLRSLKQTFDNIDAVRFSDDDFFNRLPPYGGSGIYSGGEYDNFRRSENVEDRRKEKYSQNPWIFDENPQWYWDYLNDDAKTNVLSRAAGIEALLRVPIAPLIDPL